MYNIQCIMHSVYCKILWKPKCEWGLGSFYPSSVDRYPIPAGTWLILFIGVIVIIIFIIIDIIIIIKRYPIPAGIWLILFILVIVVIIS